MSVHEPVAMSVLGEVPVMWVPFVAILGVAVAALLILVLARWVVWPAFKGIGWFVGGVFGFIGREFRDSLRLIGALVTSVVYIPLILGTVLIGRWSASAHFGRSMKAEMGLAGKCVYRLVAANFLTSFGMRDVVAGIEERVPQALAEAPGSDEPRRKSGQFEGYSIVGSLAGGGSGGKLYIAEPDALKVAAFERNGHFHVGQVVLKVFSLRDGSSLPQIVRESRALDAARKLGLVLDHELTPERFHYVMRYVPGQSLTAVTHQLHAGSTPPVGSRGLDDTSLRTAMGLIADLVATLDAYHRGGLWHKDVKPDNIIVDGKRAHLVDFGLVTPLRSAMTLTTHGTEYFRDPEMVKMAHKGVKVHEVDGAKFDIFGAGAVLYSLIENSFPAHGALSQISMRCPEGLRWVVRRAMTEYDKRYPTAAAMLRDLEMIRHAPDMMAIKPGQLPSMQEGSDELPEPPVVEPMPDYPVARVRQAASPASPAMPPPLPVGAGVGAGVGAAGGGFGGGAGGGVGAAGIGGGRAWDGASAAPSRPEVSILNWWTGAFSVTGGVEERAEPAQASRFGGSAMPRERKHGAGRVSAAQQLENARSRAASARDRARQRLGGRFSMPKPYSNNPNAGSYVAVAAAIGFAMLVMFGGIFTTTNRTVTVTSSGDGMQAPMELEADPRGGTVRNAADAGSATSVLGAHALVIVDLKKPLAEAHAKWIREAAGRMADAGFELTGDFPGAEESQRDIDQTASAIAAAGGLAVDTPQGAAAVGDWIAASGKQFDLIVWIKPIAGGKDQGGNVEITPIVIQPPVNGEDPSDVRLRKALGEAARRSLRR